MYELAWFNGRFSPVHNAHLNVMRMGLMLSKHLLITIGSCNAPRTPKNPWNASEREQMIRVCFTPEENKRITIKYMEDRLHNDHLWASRINSFVEELASERGFPANTKTVVTIGSDKDKDSYWIHMFPQWEKNLFEEQVGYDSTDFRMDFFRDKAALDDWHGTLEPRVINWLRGWSITKHYDLVKTEQEFLDKHADMWKNSPYPVSFNCADAVVFKDSHVLLVKRRYAPGKGLWAIPGGYINVNEKTLDSAIRELREETCLKVPIPVLEGSLIGQRVFDHPRRSQRGRIFSHAFAFELKQPGPLPKVRGADDGEKAQWFPLSEFRNMRSVMFEDHADIVNHFIGFLKPR